MTQGTGSDENLTGVGAGNMSVEILFQSETCSSEIPAVIIPRYSNCLSC